MSSQAIILVVVVLVVGVVGGYFFYKSTKACPDKCSHTSCSNYKCIKCTNGYGIDGTMTPDSSGKCPVYRSPTASTPAPSTPAPSIPTLVTWTQRENLDISGSAGSTIDGASIDDCRTACKAIPDCVGASFDGSKCHLKDVPGTSYCTTTKSGWKITTNKTLPSCA
jgi:hypothetical protein